VNERDAPETGASFLFQDDLQKSFDSRLPTLNLPVNELFCHRRLGFHWRESRARIGRARASREGVAAGGE
jgi:hypothetical protein